MKSKNQLIYLVRNMIGEDEPDGFYTPVETIDGVIKVPNYLFKDAPAEYPEIRISPFISDVEQIRPRKRLTCEDFLKIRHYKAIFQIDIYATTIPMVNTIYETVFNRLDLFNQYDVVKYGYNRSFRKIKENTYFSPIYESKSFNIFRILIDNYIIHQVDNIELLKNNTYLINEDGLYIKTPLPIQHLEIFHAVNGLILQKKSKIANHIINMEISNKKMLSELENNSVERISFDLTILYHMEQMRKLGPWLEDIEISCDENGRQKRRKKD